LLFLLFQLRGGQGHANLPVQKGASSRVVSPRRETNVSAIILRPSAFVSIAKSGSSSQTDQGRRADAALSGWEGEAVTVREPRQKVTKPLLYGCGSDWLISASRIVYKKFSGLLVLRMSLPQMRTWLRV